MFYLIAPNTESYELIFSDLTIVTGQLFINSNHCLVKSQNVYKKKMQHICIMYINFET